MVDFNSLRKNRKDGMKALTSKVESMTSSSGNRDERLWKPGFDKQEGKGYAVVRFLPPQFDQDPFQRVFFHSFRGKGGMYFETSRKTLDQKEDDPVAISNRLYWNKGEADGDDSLKNVARDHKRKVRYYANVYVIKDSINPENEGKVKVFEFGAQIFEKIQDAIKPEFEGENPVDPFDMWEGANFIIKATGREMPAGGKKIIVPNYEKSAFEGNTSGLFGDDDDKKKEVFEQTHDLTEFVKVKTFDELADRFLKVTGEKYNALETGEGEQSQVDKLRKEAEEQYRTEEREELPEKDESVSGAEEDNSSASDDDSDDDDDIFDKIRNGEL